MQVFIFHNLYLFFIYYSELLKHHWVIIMFTSNSLFPKHSGTIQSDLE